MPETLLCALWLPALLHLPHFGRHTPKRRSVSTAHCTELPRSEAVLDPLTAEQVAKAELIAWGLGNTQM